MNRACLIALFLLAADAAQAQLDLPVRLELTADSAIDRRITGLDAPQAPADGVPADVERAGTLTWITSGGQDSLVASWPQVPLALGNGLMHITVVPGATNSGPATLTLPGTGAVPILKYAVQPLDSADLQAGSPVELVHDGAAWQVVSPLPRPCPTGMRAASRDLCVEVQPTTGANFYAAANGCASRGARLCTFGEWIAACTMSNGIAGSIVDYEWVDHGANNTNDGKTMGINAGTLLPDCLSGGTRAPLTVLTYRCCADR